VSKSAFEAPSLRCLAVLALLLTAASCAKLAEYERKRSQAAPSAFPVVIVARSDAQKPLSGVEIGLGKKIVGKTDGAGEVRLELRGNEGNTVLLSVRCPETFASPDKPITVGLRQLSPGSPPPTFETACVPLVRKVVVGLRAENGPNLPIMRLNQLVGRTDAQGTAHVMLQAAPDEQVVLTLDTSNSPQLRPQNPTLTFVARDRDELLLLEQKFSVLKPKVVRQARAIPKPL
jgi:hypothetical protein